MYDPTDTMTITIPKHTGHLLNSLACAAYGQHKPKHAYNPKNQEPLSDDAKALADYIQAYADAAQKTT